VTTIRTITQDGERFVSLKDLLKAMSDPEMLAEAKCVMAAGLQSKRSEDEIITTGLSSIVATGIGDVPPLNFKPHQQN
jgi:hypothetical protein